MDSNTPKRKATSGKAANQDNTQPNDITLLTKYLAVMYASTDKKLSGGDIAVLLQLMDYFNPRKGYAYPSMDTLAFNTNLTKRTIVTCISRLRSRGYLEIVRQGNRTTSNRYLPIFHDYVRPTKPDSDIDTTVQSTSPYTVQSTATIGEVQRNELVQSTSPNTTYEPAHKAGDIGGGVAIAPPGATRASPLGAIALAPNNHNLKYPEFWAVYPKQRNVSAANAEITLALARGVSMATMVEAAQRYVVYIAAQQWGDKQYTFTKFPKNFIKDECWLEDYSVKPTKVNPKAGEIAKKPSTKEDGRKLIYELHNVFHSEGDIVKVHANACKKCESAYEAYSEDGEPNQDDYCKIGKKLFQKEMTASKKWCAACDCQEKLFDDRYEGDRPPDEYFN